jgi:polyisoprenoid-binding protein YceI
MKKNIFLFVLFAMSHSLLAQRFISESSQISFFSSTPLENIEASTNEAKSLFDVSNGQIAFSVPIQSFVFEKSLMRKHFNDSYLESEKYPKATFKGTVSGFNLNGGKQKVRAKGDLVLHGVPRTITSEGTMEVKNGKITLLTSFPVQLEDHQIKVPKVVFYNIAKEVQVKINILYKPYEK